MRWISIILYKEFWLLLLYLIPGKVKQSYITSAAVLSILYFLGSLQDS